MEIKSTEKRLQESTIGQQLTHMGWSPFFETQYDAHGQGLTPARIVGVGKNRCLARHDSGEVQAAIAGKLSNQPGFQYPVVGDWVLLRESMIIAVLERSNVLSRRAAGTRSRRDNEARGDDQVMAANLDLVGIVCGLDRDFNPRRIERYLTLVYNCGIEPVILLTKADLHPSPQTCVWEVESIAPGVKIHALSLDDDESIHSLRELFPVGRTAALIGSSGAGKSTLINRLYGEEIRLTSSVGDRVGKGRHTTTSRDLLVLPDGGMVIDNPGIREVALAMDGEGTEAVFPDIEEAAKSCRFSDCSHSHEPGCKVVRAVEKGLIEVERLKSYQKLMGELSYYREREHKSAAKVERDRWKGVAQKIKSIKKRR